MVFGVKFGYGRRADTSLLGNGFTRKDSIKQKKKHFLLNRKKVSDYDCG